MSLTGKQPHFKPWRLPSGCQIPLNEPFRASEIGLPAQTAKSLADDGFIEEVGRERTKETRSHRKIWRATGKLRDAMVVPAKRGKHKPPLCMGATRDALLLEYIRDFPGLTIPELAKKMHGAIHTTRTRIKNLISLKLIKGVVCKTGKTGGQPIRYYAIDEGVNS